MILARRISSWRAVARGESERKQASNLTMVFAAQSALRLYPAETGVGIGQRGRIKTFVQSHLDLLSDERNGYKWLLFSAEVPKSDGKFRESPVHPPPTCH